MKNGCNIILNKIGYNTISNSKDKEIEVEKIKDKKSKYTAPSLIKLGDVNKKTLGGHYYRWDSMSSSTACMDQGGWWGDPCHMEYFS